MYRVICFGVILFSKLQIAALSSSTPEGLTGDIEGLLNTTSNSTSTLISGEAPGTLRTEGERGSSSDPEVQESYIGWSGSSSPVNCTVTNRTCGDAFNFTKRINEIRETVKELESTLGLSISDTIPDVAKKNEGRASRRTESPLSNQKGTGASNNAAGDSTSAASMVTQKNQRIRNNLTASRDEETVKHVSKVTAIPTSTSYSTSSYASTNPVTSRSSAVTTPSDNVTPNALPSNSPHALPLTRYLATDNVTPNGQSPSTVVQDKLKPGDPLPLLTSDPIVGTPIAMRTLKPTTDPPIPTKKAEENEDSEHITNPLTNAPEPSALETKNNNQTLISEPPAPKKPTLSPLETDPAELEQTVSFTERLTTSPTKEPGKNEPEGIGNQTYLESCPRCVIIETPAGGLRFCNVTECWVPRFGKQVGLMILCFPVGLSALISLYGLYLLIPGLNKEFKKNKPLFKGSRFFCRGFLRGLCYVWRVFVLFVNVYFLTIFTTLFDVFDVYMDFLMGYKLEMGQVIEPHIYRNVWVINLIFIFAFLGLIKVAICLHILRTKGEMVPLYISKSVCYCVGFLLEDCGEMFLEYFYIENYLTQAVSTPWFLLTRNAIYCVLSLRLLIIHLEALLKTCYSKKSETLGISFFLTSVIIGIVSLFRTGGAIYQKMTGNLNVGCLEVVEGRLLQSPFRRSCMKNVNYAILALCFLPILLLPGAFGYYVHKNQESDNIEAAETSKETKKKDRLDSIDCSITLKPGEYTSIAEQLKTTVAAHGSPVMLVQTPSLGSHPSGGFATAPSLGSHPSGGFATVAIPNQYNHIPNQQVQYVPYPVMHASQVIPQPVTSSQSHPHMISYQTDNGYQYRSRVGSDNAYHSPQTLWNHAIGSVLSDIRRTLPNPDSPRPRSMSVSEFTTNCRCESCLHYKKLGMQGYGGLMGDDGLDGVPIVDRVTSHEHDREHIYEELDRIRRVQHLKCSSAQDTTARVRQVDDCNQEGVEVAGSATVVDPDGGMLGSPEPGVLERRSFRSRSAPNLLEVDGESRLPCRSAPNLLEVDGRLHCRAGASGADARFRLSLLEEVVI